METLYLVLAGVGVLALTIWLLARNAKDQGRDAQKADTLEADNDLRDRARHARESLTDTERQRLRQTDG